MSTPLSNIRVFVQWTEQTVFAGEDVECQITFKNVASTPAPSRASLHPPVANGYGAGDRQSKGPVSQIRGNPALSPRAGFAGRGHRATLSLNAPASSVRSQPVSSSWTGTTPKAAHDASAHQRSVSIISIGASEGKFEDTRSSRFSETSERPGAMSRGHKRSASLQVVPRRLGMNGGPPSAPLNMRSTTQPHSSPLISSFLPGIDFPLPERPARRPGIATAPSTPGLSGASSTKRKPPTTSPQAFQFPAFTAPAGESKPEHPSDRGRQSIHLDGARLLSPRSKDVIPTIKAQAAPMTRVLSPASVAGSVTGTPRSSGEFYSLSNNSTETLASEYLPQQTGRISPYGAHARRPSNLAPVNHHRPPETLMMGYAQINGSFTLDGSLISQAPFEEVKRKGAVGGQGGGVIGVESHKRDSGLLRSFGWANIGESIGGLLGGGELSSIKDMRGAASSRSIPLLSTPQSILFVDLRLTPGESKSYQYTFKLPRGLPPSHRGKAIKISYKLIIGTQRPGGAKEQQVKSVEVPFRVLGSVNAHGELLGHDLMSPYIILRDRARVKTVENSDTNSTSSKELEVKKTLKSGDSTLSGFLLYVDQLLAQPRQNSSYGLLSPTEPLARSRRQSSIEEPATAKEAIDIAILRSNVTTETQQSANRFEIARSGKRVAVVMLARPAYRLGESITAAIDFTDAEIPCYAIHASLESSEKVDSSIALRSEASILRVTRKVHASHSESTLFARRIIFAPTIPVSATPDFLTSGVSLDWRVRIEFVTPRLVGHGQDESGYADLLEEISRDERGVVLAAAEALDCESFEIAVPLRVYGAVAGNNERDEVPSDGLVV